ncbi:MAG: ABC transporter substrate-binding protein [Microbacterium sp. SCN 70-200]|uniref:ABC transporter substrate-binding protein n=1 Tax=unclassified Microbacterium TaxID=2609290 RepID=UPI00086CBFE8|nr:MULTISPECIES: transporter substrate-binding domain-containing protein [unclassified Microbacterium]MBN9213761.1 amino acid ABC transporter substrate-binding protein [Microbacterium sp.]ODT42321.1 MAG: ABC transporter substrate-binding protein [Microbacterium sp. SCN 70-200]OJV85551.1 MAG: amino acid ABC transporter substrate-binding protein [Microbacterium sp. 70-16]
MTRLALRTTLAATAASALLLLAGCAGSTDPAASDSASADAGAAVASDAYVTPGKLTIATGETAYEPYVIDDDPASGKGFEAAVAYAVADQLGFSADDVVWVRTSFESAIAPGPKSFDFNIQQYTITDERKQAVDFSSPYYEASQSVVAVKGGKADGISDLAGLKDLVLGAMTGSTSATTLEEAIAPTTAPQLYNSNEDAVAALKAGQIDAIVLDTPTAYVATVVPYIDDSFVVGQLPAAGVPDQWGLLLAKDSPLTMSVTEAVDTLRENGTLDELEQEWLGVLTDGIPQLG